MTCAQYEPLIALYVEGDLPVADTPLVEEHVAVCADCRELLQDLRASQAVVKELGTEPVDGALLTAVRAGVLAKIGDRRVIRESELQRLIVDDARPAKTQSK